MSDPLSLASFYGTKNLKTSNSPTFFKHHIATHPQLQSPKEPNDPSFLLFCDRPKERSYKFKSEGDECPENTNNPQNDEQPNKQTDIHKKKESTLNVVINFCQNPQKASRLTSPLSHQHPRELIWQRTQDILNQKTSNISKYLILSLSSLYGTKHLKISNNPIFSKQSHPIASRHVLNYKLPQNQFDPGFSILSGSTKERESIQIKFEEGLELMINVPNWT